MIGLRGICFALALLAVACGTNADTKCSSAPDVTEGAGAPASETEVRAILARSCALGG